VARSKEGRETCCETTALIVAEYYFYTLVYYFQESQQIVDLRMCLLTVLFPVLSTPTQCHLRIDGFIPKKCSDLQKAIDSPLPFDVVGAYHKMQNMLLKEQELIQVESQLSTDVLQNISSKKSNPNFVKTVLAVFRIVDDKLYRVRAHSLEQYFKERWQISRAQVYRFYNCARVLQVSILSPIFY
jgi:hypothetical protein